MVDELGDYWGGTLTDWVGEIMMYGYGPDKTPFHGARATLLPYDPTVGEAEFYLTDGEGGIMLLRRHNNWLPTWDIVSGDFLENP